MLWESSGLACTLAGLLFTRKLSFRRGEPFLIPFSRDFKTEDGKAVIPLGVTVQGDVLVIIYHARATLGGRLQAKVHEHPGPLGHQPVGSPPCAARDRGAASHTVGCCLRGESTGLWLRGWPVKCVSAM